MEIVGLDFPCMDCLIHLERRPLPNESMRITETSLQGGGKVATALAAVGRLGVSGAIIGSVTDDHWGHFCKEDLEYHGIHTERLRVLPGWMGLNYVISDKESQGRSILYSGIERSPYELEEEDLAMIRTAKILHLASCGAVQQQAAEAARQAGVTVFYDGDAYSPQVEEILPKLDVLIGSEFFYRDYFHADGASLSKIRENCLAFREKYRLQIAGFTFGGSGSAAADDTGFYFSPAPKVKVVDTVGAGDTYHGAFVCGMAKGWKLPEILRFAGTVASMKCRYIGGRAGIPTMEMVERFWNGDTEYEGDIPERLERYRRG